MRDACEISEDCFHHEYSRGVNRCHVYVIDKIKSQMCLLTCWSDSVRKTL